MRTLFALALALALAGTTSAPAAAASVTACGTLQAFTDSRAQEGISVLTIDGKTYRLSSALSAKGLNTIGPGVAVGARVCLFGELVPTTSDLLHDYTLTLCAAGSAAAGCTATLPSTSTEGGFPSLPVLAAQLVLVVLAASVIVWRRSVQRAA